MSVPKRCVLVLTAVLLSSLTFPLTITGASLALSGIREDLDAGLAATQWVVNGYNACFASFLVFTGSLADVLGRRRIYAAGLALFCASSAMSALADDVLVLNLVRAVGGVGAAAATTGGSSLLAATFQGAARSRAFGLLGTVLGVGLAFGPTVGGVLVETLGWRAVFAVPALIAGLVLLLVPALPALPGEPGRGIDWPGAALFTSALFLLIFALDEGPALGFGNPLVVGGFVAALGLGVAFVAVERRRPDPLFQLDLLVNRRFLALAVAAGAHMGVLVPLLVYLPSYLISVVGLSAGQAGIWLLMLTLPTVFLPTAGAVVSRWLRPMSVVLGTVALSGIGALALVTVGPDSTPLHLLVPLVLIGAGVGLSNGILDGLAIGSVPTEQAGAASGTFNTARLVTETIALAAVGAVLAAVGGGQLTGAAFTSGLHVASVLLSCAAAIAIGCVVVLLRRAELVEHR
ncbi:MFS transporter [Saccharopolyspora oryzae]|uniref:MFS transporter n=1 Tax=Saccharopolyspora oryzae TaxID=2997343 RepID=A0ABT4UZX1_9PSEU|nr:MFS transporter [Saccharopolyspora oryzae]MDA3627238.1 MFS transporter [Saccharopolyspora oryzae]